MGLFDEVRFECKLPFDFQKLGFFQTKDLGCRMENYQVGKDKKIRQYRYTKSGHRVGNKVCPIYATMRFYTLRELEADKREWIELSTTIVNGSVKKIKLIKREKIFQKLSKEKTEK